MRTLAAVAAAAWMVAGGLWWRSQKKQNAQPPAPVTTSTAATSAGAKPGAAASAAPSSSAVASASLPEVTDVSACVQDLFAKGTFEKKPNFAFVCEETSAIKGGTRIKIQIVMTKGKGVSEGMREWAGLGWYEMGGFSVVRARCCPQPLPKRKWSFAVVPNCPVDKALDGLEEAVRDGDTAKAGAASEEYNKAVRCLSQFGQGSNFKRTGPPGAGKSMLDKFLARAVAR